MTTQQTKVDWSRPIEAAHEDGRVVAVTASYAGPGYFDIHGHDEIFIAKSDGGTRTRWRIHNVAQSYDDTVQLPTPSPELTARMVALVRELANSRYGIALADKARAIAAELEPVDGDRAMPEPPLTEQRVREIVQSMLGLKHRDPCGHCAVTACDGDCTHVKSCRRGTVQRKNVRGPYAYSLAPAYSPYGAYPSRALAEAGK